MSRFNPHRAGRRGLIPLLLGGAWAIGVLLCPFRGGICQAQPTPTNPKWEKRAPPTLKDLQLLLRVDPKNVNGWIHFGIELSRANQPDKAIVAFTQAAALDPNNFHAYNNLGIAYKNVGQLENAIVHYTQAVSINPNSYWTWYNIALTYEDLQLWPEAHYSLKQVLKLHPDFAAAKLHLSRVEGFIALSQQKVYSLVVKNKEERDLTVEERQKAKRVANPKSIFYAPPDRGIDSAIAEMKKGSKPAEKHFGGALEALKKGDIPNAVREYLLAIDLANDFLSQKEYGLIAKGIAHFQKNQETVVDIYNYGRLLHLNGDIMPAFFTFNRLLEKYPGTPEAEKIKPTARYLDVLIHGEKKARLDEFGNIKPPASDSTLIDGSPPPAAVATSTPATPVVTAADGTLVEQIPGDDGSQSFEKGNELFKKGQMEGALGYFLNAIKLNPNASAYYHKLGDTYAEKFITGDAESGQKAISAYEKEMEMDPSSPTTQDAKTMIAEIKKRVK